jgi:O-glycosyl hydrolase
VGEGTPQAIMLAATDPNGDGLTYTVVDSPQHGTLSGTAPNLTYAPAAGFTGTDSFTFKANDGQADSNVATVSITVAPSQAATASVDGSVRYQTIDGFGGAESWLLPPTSMYPAIFDDLGVSILRFQMFAYTESLPDQPGDESRDNDNDDPFVIDWNGVHTGIFTAFAPLLQAARSRGVKIIGTTWSPPAWMKDNNLVESAGTFNSGYEDELVEFILIWVNGMERYHGVHIDSVTIQNEPDNLPPWPGCKYTPAQLRDVIKRRE